MHITRRTSIPILVAATAVAVPTAVLAHGGGGGHCKHRGGHHGRASAQATIALPNGWQPEGIAAGRGALYVGSIPTGGVYKADPRTGKGAVFVQGRTGRAATGMKVAGRLLVVSGGTTGHAYVYDAETGADVADVTLTTGNSFVNDVAVAGRYAYFTDSRQAQLYRLDLGTRGVKDDHGGKDDRGGHMQHGPGPDDHGGKAAKRLSRGGDDHGKHGGHGADDSPSPSPSSSPSASPSSSPTPSPTGSPSPTATGVASTATTIPLTGALAASYDDDPATNETNGIVALPGGKTLVVVNSRTGQLYTVDAATGASSQIALTGGDGNVLNGDGLLLKGRTLYAVQNRLNQIAVVDLGKNATTATIRTTITNPAFRVPTTLAKDGKSLFAVNARFGTPATPDTDYDIVRVGKR